MNKKNRLKIDALQLWLNSKMIKMVDLYKWLNKNHLYHTKESQFRALHFAEQFDAEHPESTQQDRLKVYDCLMTYLENY